MFDEHLVAVHMKKTEVYFNKPIYVGQAILDLSKTLMFDFHYNLIRKKYGNKAEAKRTSHKYVKNCKDHLFCLYILYF